jgi:hypothetical protein
MADTLEVFYRRSQYDPFESLGTAETEREANALARAVAAGDYLILPIGVDPEDHLRAMRGQPGVAPAPAAEPPTPTETEPIDDNKPQRLRGRERGKARKHGQR